MKATDADLLAGVVHGDRPALDELVRRYVDFVYAAAVRQLNDAHTAEDVTQAVFLVLAKKAGRVHAPALAAWLHRTTVYAAANARRAVRRRRQHERAAAKPEAAMSAVPPDIATRDLLARLDAAIAALPPKDRIAVCGRYLLGEDLTAVATALDTTPAAAQKRIERTVDALRRRLSRDHEPAIEPAIASGGTVASAAVASSTVLAALALAAPSPATAAPPALALAAASTSATSIAKGVIVMTLTSKAKIAAAVVAAVLLGTAGVEGVRRFAAVPAARPAATGPASLDPALVGRWQTVRDTSDEGVLQADLTAGQSIEIAADGQCVLRFAGTPNEAARLVIAGAAGEIDFTTADGKRRPARYAVANDRLRLRYADADGPRPDSLDRPGRAAGVTEILFHRTPVVADDGKSEAQFADGVTVELIAIGEPATGQWWTPDGRPAPVPAGADLTPVIGKPGPGERRLRFVTEIRSADGEGVARGRIEPLPRRAPFTMWGPLPGRAPRRDQTDIVISAADETSGFHVDVAAAAPRTLTMWRAHFKEWPDFAAGSLRSPGGQTYTVSHPQTHDGHPAFEIGPYDADRFKIDDLTMTLIGPGGEEWPCALDPVEEATPPKLLAWSSKWTLSDVVAARLTLHRYDRGVDFFGFARRPGGATAVRTVVHEPPAARDPAK